MKKLSLSLLPVVLFLLTGLSARSEDELPNGNGEELVQSACTGCHDLRRTTQAGYTRAKDGRTNLTTSSQN